MTAGGRVWPWLDPALFAGSLVIYALALPLGLGRVEVAPLVAAGLALDTSTLPLPFTLLAVRVADFLPLGDSALRANLASALLCALAVALVGRLALEVVALLRPPAHARQESRDFLHEPIAAAGAALAAALSLSVFQMGVGAGSAPATLLLLLGGLLAGFFLLQNSNAHLAGYALAALGGLATGVDPIAGPLLWPPLAALSLWSLRKGARWPLLAPLCFVVGWGGAGLGTLAAASTALSASSLLPHMRSLAVSARATLLSTAIELGDEVGVIGVLLAAIGMVALASRALVLSAWLALTGLTSLLFARLADPVGDAMAAARAAMPLAIVVSFVFASVGLLHVSARLGRARMASSLALAVILLFSPALDRGSSRWHRRAGPPMHLLDRALERARLRSMVLPGSAEMEGLFRLARAMGLRPDLEIVGSAGKH